MKLVALQKSEQNQAVLDPWSAVHVGIGLACGLVDMSLVTALSAAISYEVVEQFAERTDEVKNIFTISGPEIPANSVMDVVLFAAGWWLGRRWNES